MSILECVEAVDQRIDRRLGERIEVRPQAPESGVAPGGPDAERPAFVVTAMVLAPTGRDVDVGGNHRNFHARIRGGRIIVSVRSAEFSGRSIREGDLVAALDRDGVPVWRIARIDDEGFGRTELEVER